MPYKNIQKSEVIFVSGWKNALGALATQNKRRCQLGCKSKIKKKSKTN